MADKDLGRFEELVEIIRKLRAMDGCPWDRQQTHKTLRENLLGETYEVLEALDDGDMKKLCDELGDLLMQIVFHVQIAAEAGEFVMGDVVKSINEKLIRRHPHIFGTTKVKNAADVAHNWELIKKKERQADASILESVPKDLPALAYGQEIQRRVAQAGFDWKDIEGVIDKLNEEIREFEQAAGEEEKSMEFGDMLFTLVNYARRHGINSETAMRETNRRFYRRFTFMENLCRERGMSFDKLTFDEQNRLWDEAKKGVDE
jgi:tetrapyrrole methylase family protein / MazG family protein